MSAVAPGSAGADSVLDLDPDLGSGIQASDWDLARRAIPAELLRVACGSWAMPDPRASRDDIVALVVSDGVLAREVVLGDHHAIELLCRGDVLLRPYAPEGPDAGTPVRLSALCDSAVMTLGAPFLRALARWPALLANLHRRVEDQRHRVAIQSLTMHLPRAADRLLLTLWVLAESCGRVAPDGTVIPLNLTHDTLGRLTAARRPTVTLALRALEAAGLVTRRGDGHLVLTSAAEEEVDALTRTSRAAPNLGTTLRLDLRPPAGQRLRALTLAD
jgi:DNA-binding transcriptional ArsR family regulator